VLAKVLASGHLQVSLDITTVAKAKYVVIAIGTPVDEYLHPKTRQFVAFFAQLKQHLRPSQTIIVRSSVYPQMCARMYRMLESDPAQPQGWQLAYCPERIVQGYAMEELPKLPQIVSGMTEPAAQSAAELFQLITPHIVHTTVEEAELVKLMANAWRYIKFSVANQFYMICEQNGIDYHRVRNAMREGYERAMDIPGPGFAAGPCLLKDTMQLSSYSGNTFQLGHSAMMVNEGLPDFLVRQLEATHDLVGLRVGILGMAFKADIDDPRDSLSYRLAKILQFRGAELYLHDPFIDDSRFSPLETVLAQSEVIFVAVPHSAYKGLALPASTHRVDLWNCTC
jgi:UDP-N-acetyl-D-mannosaminuronic acid dehydrogenase